MKTVIGVAVAALLACTACNTETTLGPEYLTRPAFGEVTISPAVPVGREVVSVRVPVSSEYGLSRIYIVYALEGDDEETIVGERRYNDSSLKSLDYEGKIPGVRAGSIVKFCVFARSYYGVGMATDVMEYVVVKDAESAASSAASEARE